MAIYKSIEDERQNVITLPSGHYCRYQLIPVTLCNTVELVVLRTNIHELIKIYRAGQSIYLNEFGDSILLEGTKIVFN